ncbi:MAG: kelch repeat-containing protein, partial [Elusimicrobiota bacterium]|nr:kelch repeat-containing protein [Elusimicrobiota bacterium]
LITGGTPNSGTAALSTAELYDPSAGTFSTTGSMSTARESYTATLLPNGKVLIAGGTSDGSVTLSTAELYDPSAGTFSNTGSMTDTRYSHTATLLPSGKVLIAGGRITGGSFLSTAELYDPSTGTFSTTGSMTIARSYHTATLLPNGKVLITGGSFSGALSTAELYDPLAGTFSTTGSMSTARKYHTAVLLPNGKVLITGGTAGAGAVLSTAELYDPSAGTFSTTGSMSAARYYYTATLLPNGKVLIIGGWDNSGTCVSTVELYDPSAGTFSTTGSMLTVRYYHTATLLPSGKVLITGGGDFWVGFATAELVSYTEYDYSVVASTMQPSIALVAGSGSFPVNISKDTVYTIIGQRFKGYSEGSGGNSGQMNSPTNYPRVYLQKMDTGNSDSIDVTTSVYPMTSAQWQNADTSISFKTPNNLSSGFWLLYVMSNAIPSNGVEVNCVWPSAETTTPSVPSAFSGVAQSTTAINWSWTDNSSSELGYRVKTSTGGTIKTLSADTTCWTEISLTPNTQYSRYVVSYNLSGESAASSSEAKYTLANPPAGVTVTGVTNTTIDLSWNANGGSLFKIERSLSGSGLWTAATDYYALTTFSDTSLIQGTTYLYRLWGYNVDNAISVEPLGVVSTTTSTSLVETPDAIDIPDAEIAVSSISCSIKVPQEGKRISGNRVTVMAEITNGELSGIKSITFKYRPTNSATWLDITAANINHPNPDIDSPYFIHWDVTILTEGAYNIRAVLKDKDNNYSTGEAITVYVDKAKPDVEENVIGEISQKKEKITSAQESIITVGNTKNNAYIEVKIPTGAVTTETIIKVENDVSDPPEIKNFEKIQLFDITLESGQTELQNGATAQITISYPDINNDGIIDETSIKENDLSIFSYNENQSVWERNNTTKTDKTKKTCTAYIKHFSIYGLFRAVSNNLGDILLYPNPYIPFDGKSDNGKPYSASDSYSGIIFENITQNIKLEIYTVSGECVLDKYIDETAGRYQWDAKNGDGKDVASGIYVAVIKSPLTGQKKIKKIAIVR